MTEAKRQDFRLVHRLRVRWAEVDLQRIVFNPHYLMYIDTAFTEYWRALAVPYEVIPAMFGGDLYVKKSVLEYHGSAHLDEMLDVGVKCERIGNSSMLFRSAIFHGDALLVTGELVYVFADPATQKSRSVPPSLRELIERYEAGVPTIGVELGSWAELGDRAAAIRREVFIDELRIAAGLDHDPADLDAVHALVRNGLGQALATARLTPVAPGVVRIARVAVTRAMRSAGLGRRLIDALVQLAARRGDTRVLLCSQGSAQPFYLRLGFVPVGEPFMEAGVPHIEMARDLAPD